VSISSDVGMRIDSASLNVRAARYVPWLRLVKISLSCVLLFAALGYVIAHGDRAALGVVISNISWVSISFACTLLLTGALLASLRLQLVARDLGYSLSFRDAASALGLGHLIGSLLFKVIGQVAARGAFLSRRNIPVSGTIIATGYERLLALLVSLSLAVTGAIYLFGHISFNRANGGMLVIKLALGVSTAGLGGALMSWWPRVKSQLPRLSVTAASSVVRNLALSLIIQITTMTAYVVLTKSLAPDLSTTKLMAASTLVMLGASLPISLAGWGMREMSAILALGAIGVGAEASLAIAITIGLLTNFVVGAITLITVGAHWPTRCNASEQSSLRFDYGMLLDYAIPLAACSAIFIQAFLPMKRGPINVNLADPLAIIGGCLFVAQTLAQTMAKLASAVP